LSDQRLVVDQVEIIFGPSEKDLIASGQRALGHMASARDRELGRVLAQHGPHRL
jgi:hypothetical protein